MKAWLSGCKQRIRAQALLRPLLILLGMPIASAEELVPDRLPKKVRYPDVIRSMQVEEAATWRGNIYDRTGLLLSTSMTGVVLGADPRSINLRDQHKLADLAQRIRMDPLELRAKLLAGADSPYVELKRNLPPALEAELSVLDIPALQFARMTTRVHAVPYEVFELLGEVDATGTGISGLELLLNDSIKGSVGTQQLTLNRMGAVVPADNSSRLSIAEEAKLTLDARLQLFAHLCMQRLLQTSGVAHAQLIVIDSATGELLAAVQASAADEPKSAPGIRLLVSRTFEPGATFAPFVIAAGLQSGAITSQTRLRQDNRALSAILDATLPRGRKSLLVSEVFAKPSSLSIATAGMRIKQTTLSDMLASIGVARGPALGFPGESAGTLSALPPWGARDQALIATGRKFTMTLPQLARAYAVLAGRGRLPSVTVIHAMVPPEGTQILAPEVASQVLGMLALKKAAPLMISHVNDITHAKLGVTHRRKQALAAGLSGQHNHRIAAALMLEMSAVRGEQAEPLARQALSRALRGTELLLNRRMTLKRISEEGSE